MIAQIPCVKGLQLLMGNTHGTLVDRFHCSDEEQLSGTALHSLIKRLMVL